MAPAASSTQVLAPHITPRTLKTFTEDRDPVAISETEREVAILSFREHLTSRSSRPKRYDDAEVYDASQAMVGRERKLESGLFGAICMAYSGHYNLHLRPDDIWLAVAQGVSTHLQYKDNAERYRDKFVDHEGKEVIEIFVDGLDTGDGKLLRWPECVQLIVNQLEKRVKGDTGKLLVNDFSTTDVISKTASQIVLMDAMKHYFVYTMSFDCGIPSVTLHGTLADWQRLQEKARALRALKIGLDTWLNKLDPVLQKLVETYQGKVDEGWWSKVVCFGESYGSGPSAFPITGWLTSFFPYEVNGDKIRPCDRIMSDTVPKGLVECPFNIVGRADVQTDNLLVAGSCGVSVTEDGRGVMPCIGWLVKRAPPDAKKEKDGKKIGNAMELSFTGGAV